MFTYIIKDHISSFNLYYLITFFLLNLIIFNSIFIYYMKNPIYSLILLIVNYFLVSFLFVYNGFVFVGLVFMLIYTGAISILLIFTLMLLNLRTIYYKSQNIVNAINIYIFIFLFEIILFFALNSKYTVYYSDNYLYLNWFNYSNFKIDILSISLDLILNNSELVLICSLLLTFLTIGATSIIANFGENKKQEFFIQIKKYKKNILK